MSGSVTEVDKVLFLTSGDELTFPSGLEGGNPGVWEGDSRRDSFPTGRKVVWLTYSPRPVTHRCRSRSGVRRAQCVAPARGSVVCVGMTPYRQTVADVRGTGCLVSMSW